jgi:hypothetical protein
MENILDTLQGARLARLVQLMRKSTEPESTKFGDEGVLELIYEFGSSVYDALTDSGLSLSFNKPSRLDVAARPAYCLTMVLAAFALYWNSGPLLAQSKLTRTSYVGDDLTWQFNATTNHNETEPEEATAIEFEFLVRPPAASAPTATGVRWYFNLDGTSHQAQNVTEVGALYFVSFRARYVDASNHPVSVWAYSGEDLYSNLPATV